MAKRICPFRLMLFLMWVAVAVAAASNGDPIDKTWQTYLDTPPQRAVQLAANLTSRADAVAGRVVAATCGGPLAARGGRAPLAATDSDVSMISFSFARSTHRLLALE